MRRSLTLLFSLVVLSPLAAQNKVKLFPLVAAQYTGRAGFEMGIARTFYIGTFNYSCFGCMETHAAENTFSLSFELYPGDDMLVLPKLNYWLSVEKSEQFVFGGSFLYAYDYNTPLLRPFVGLQTWKWSKRKMNEPRHPFREAFRAQLLVGYNFDLKGPNLLLAPYQVSLVFYQDHKFLPRAKK